MARKAVNVAGESNHRREKPTARYSSEGAGRRGHASARPHSSAGSSSGARQSGIVDQLEGQIGGQTAFGQSAQSQQSQQESMPQIFSPTLTQGTAPQGQSGGSGLRILPLILPLILIAVMFGGMGTLGNSCRSISSSSLFDEGDFGALETDTTTYQISDNLGAGNASETWTVLMYLCGSDLESSSTYLGGGLATSNLVELAKANLGDNVTYAIETGGARAWQNNVVSPRYLSRYTMENGAMALQENVKSASMAEQSTFADFLSWGINSYPADHYMLVIWDHGGGSITGVCLDDLYPYTKSGKADSLTLVEMRDAMEQTGASFDVIGFDTCLMASLETAEMLSPYGDYLIASEESEPGSGWDYTAWPTWLASHTGTSGADLGTVVCETYYNKCKSVRQSSMATLSVVDLSKIANVSRAFQNASDDIARATIDPTSLRLLYRGAGRSESYGSGSTYSMNMVDLGDLMNKTRDVVGGDADGVITALKDAVVYEVHGRSRAAATGLSVFYPLEINDKDDFYTYAEMTNNTPYLQFLGVMYGVYDNYDWTKFDNYVSLYGEPVNETDVGIEFVQTVGDDGHIQLDITQGADQVAAVSMEYYVYLDQLDILCYLGSDNDLNGSYDEGWFRDNFQNDWLTIDGHYVSASLAEEGDGYNLYYVPVNLNGEQTGLIVEYDYSTDEYGVICVWDESNADTGMGGRTARLLNEGDKVEFIFPAVNVTTRSQDVIPLETMEWREDPVIAYEGLGDGTFAFRYSVTDVLGNEQKSDLVFETFENGRFSSVS